MSSYEERIIILLQKGKYRFEREKRFSDLKGGKYRYDFYVDCGRGKFCLVEIQGEQHYQVVSKFHRTRAEFTKAQERDRRKISYALANHIPLYIIPYWEIDNLKTSQDLFQEKYRARDRWKNDRDYAKKPKFDKRKKF